MFSRFDENAQKILLMTKKEMLELKHPYVGSEHLLLSILHNNLDITKFLNNCGVSYDKFRDELIKIVGVGTTISNWFLFTPLLKRIVENAILDSKQNSEKVTVERLLISLLEEGEGIANRILMGMGIDIDVLYEKFANSFTYKNRHSDKKLLIEEFSVNFNKLANEGKLDPVIGRDRLINRIMEVLLRRNKNNPLLIGEAGVGKTALVEEFARRIENNQVPQELRNKKIYNVSMASLVSGTKYRGEFEERISKMIKEVENNKDIILFIDEIHTIVGAGGAEGAIDASNILKPYLARGKLKLIGATTKEEYGKYLEDDKALDRRFQKIYVEEPTMEETEEILFKLKPTYESFHDIEIEDSIIKEIVKLSSRYITKGREPDKSIDVLDCACTKTIMQDNTNEKKIKKFSNDLSNILSKKNLAIINHNFKLASDLRSEELMIESKLNKLYLENGKKNIRKEITLDILYDVIYDKTRIPVKKVSLLDRNKIGKLLRKKVIGQNKAISEILDLSLSNIKKNRVKSLLLVGKSGLGKTFLVKEYAKLLYPGDSFIKIDMSEFSDSSSISRIMGSNPGYVGYDEKNSILEKVKCNPYSVILLDEIEKAHPSVMKLFLQVFDDGYMTNSRAEKINFNNCIIFMTSNLGCDRNSVGFVDNQTNLVMEKLKKFLGIELVNRIDKIILFDTFNDKSIENIIINKLKDFCNQNNLNIDYSIYIKEIKKNCNYEEEGARGVEKAINNILGTKLIV